VQRILEAHQLAPHRIRTFKLSNDPKFVAAAARHSPRRWHHRFDHKWPRRVQLSPNALNGRARW
jgi:hypothetical protein